VARGAAYTAAEDGEWKLGMRLGGIAGKPMRHDATVRAGRVRWKVGFDVMNVADSVLRAARTQEGVVDVQAGEEVEIDVPIEPVR